MASNLTVNTRAALDAVAQRTTETIANTQAEVKRRAEETTTVIRNKAEETTTAIRTKAGEATEVVSRRTSEATEVRGREGRRGVYGVQML